MPPTPYSPSFSVHVELVRKYCFDFIRLRIPSLLATDRSAAGKATSVAGDGLASPAFPARSSRRSVRGSADGAPTRPSTRASAAGDDSEGPSLEPRRRAAPPLPPPPAHVHTPTAAPRKRPAPPKRSSDGSSDDDFAVESSPSESSFGGSSDNSDSDEGSRRRNRSSNGKKKGKANKPNAKSAAGKNGGSRKRGR